MPREVRKMARDYGWTDREMARHLIAQHMERGDPFAGDVATEASERDYNDVHGFPPSEAQDPLAGDVGGEAEAAQRLLETQLPFE